MPVNIGNFTSITHSFQVDKLYPIFFFFCIPENTKLKGSLCIYMIIMRTWMGQDMIQCSRYQNLLRHEKVGMKISSTIVLPL